MKRRRRTRRVFEFYVLVNLTLFLFRVFFLNPNTYEREREKRKIFHMMDFLVISKRFLFLVAFVGLPFVLFG